MDSKPATVSYVKKFFSKLKDLFAPKPKMVKGGDAFTRYTITTNVSNSDVRATELGFKLKINGILYGNTKDYVKSEFIVNVRQNSYGVNYDSGRVITVGVIYKENDNYNIFVDFDSARSFVGDFLVTDLFTGNNIADTITQGFSSFEDTDLGFYIGQDPSTEECTLSYYGKISSKELSSLADLKIYKDYKSDPDIYNGEGEVSITNVQHSSDTDKLAHNVLFTIKSVEYDSDGVETNLSENIVEIPFSPQIIQEVINNSSIDFNIPVATKQSLGGIKVGKFEAGTEYPVMLDNDQNAYVDLANFRVSNVVPQLKDLTNSTHPIGSIVQYSGNTNSNFVNGYFYKKVTGGYKVTFTESSIVWAFDTDFNTKLEEFNKNNKQIALDVTKDLTISFVLEGDEFKLQDGEQILRLSDGKINIDLPVSRMSKLFGIHLQDGIFAPDTYDYSFQITTNGEKWIQWNVQPNADSGKYVMCTDPSNTPDVAGGELTPDSVEHSNYVYLYKQEGIGGDAYVQYVVVETEEGKKWEKLGNTTIEGYLEFGSGQNILIESDNTISALGYEFTGEINSFATGVNTKATGRYSHSEGYGVLCTIYNRYISQNDEGDEILELQDGESHILAQELLILKNNNVPNCVFRSLNGMYAYPINWVNCNIIYINSKAKPEEIEDLSEISKDETYYLNVGHSGAVIGDRDIQIVVPTTASNQASHAEGKNTIASGKNSHAEGLLTFATKDQAHAEGHMTQATGKNSHAEGLSTTASNNQAHAEGYSTIASGNYAHAEGRDTKAEGSCAHAEGKECEASGNNSHAEGQNTTASGHCSHAEGISTIASHKYSHASGECTETGRDNQTVIGRYNERDGRAFFIVGGGDDQAKKNLLSVGDYRTYDNYSGTDVETSSVKAIVNNIENVYLGLPIGSITIWSGSSTQIPQGWMKCGDVISLKESTEANYILKSNSDKYYTVTDKKYLNLAKILINSDDLSSSLPESIDRMPTKQILIASPSSLNHNMVYIIKYE